MTEWPRLPPQTLPRPVIAFRDETVLSFTTRLARANGLPPQSLRDYATGDGRYTDPDRLGRLSGYPLEVLQNRLRGFNDDDRDPTRQQRRSRPSCRHCSARRGAFEPVYCWVPDHITVCTRHRRWIGPSARHWDDQLPLDHHPDVIHAAAAHRRLTQRHPTDTVEGAINEASRLVLRQRRFQQSEGLAASEKKRLRWATISNASTHVTTYRETVQLAAIIVDYRPVLLNLGDLVDRRITAFVLAANDVFATNSPGAALVITNWLNEQRLIRRGCLRTTV